MWRESNVNQRYSRINTWYKIILLNPEKYLNHLNSQGIEFISGVPDSLLKDFCECVSQEYSPDKHIIASNEGAAVGLAIGYHLGTNKVPMIYLQNSG